MNTLYFISQVNGSKKKAFPKMVEEDIKIDDKSSGEDDDDDDCA